MIPPVESALVVLVPEAERLIETYRERYGAEGTSGLPAHVTILYPFKSPEKLTKDDLMTLRELFIKSPSFSASFLKVSRFPDMLYLAPIPAEPFKRLTEGIVEIYPDTPPYGGAFSEIVPHLTIAQASDPQKLGSIADDFDEAVKDLLPIQVRVNTITLMDNAGGYWDIQAQFPLHPDE
jgi:2'-5' RNA ligase